jgi:hypothetical protein
MLPTKRRRSHPGEILKDKFLETLNKYWQYALWLVLFTMFYNLAEGLVSIYMSVVLLTSSLIYQFTGFGFIDSLGAFGLIYFSVNEGKEAFEKAADMKEKT